MGEIEIHPHRVATLKTSASKEESFLLAEIRFFNNLQHSQYIQGIDISSRSTKSPSCVSPGFCPSFLCKTLAGL